jgi:hypothetical protein
LKLCIFQVLKHYENTPKYNSPNRDVVSSNAPPLHSDGSHPIGGILLGVCKWHQ